MTTDTKQSDAEERKLQIGKQMAAREAERLERKKEKDKNQDANPEEDVHTFFQNFNDKLSGLRATLASIEQQGASPEQLETQLNDLREETQAVKEFVNAGCVYLPPFDQRSMQQKMTRFEQDLAAIQSRLVPRKKFGFKRKEKKKPATASVAAAEAASRHSDAGIVAAEADEVAASCRAKSVKVHDPERSLVDCTGETIVVERSRLAGGDFFIAQCKDCKIFLQGSMGALRMEQVQHCTIVTGPITGGCHIEGAEDSSFYLVTHQLRLHDSFRCDFYTHIRSNPIIEDCTGLRFAPYAEEYDGLQTDLEETELTVERCGELWCNVQDFKWLKQHQSPNWCILPEDQRVGSQLSPVMDSSVAT